MAEPHPIPSDPRFQDLSNRTFGRLSVLFYAGKKSGKYSLWHCRCECGRERTIVSSQLTLGQTTECFYCAKHKPHTKPHPLLEDLTGQTFGRLKVLSLERHRKLPKPARSYFLCECSCGEKTIVRGDQLKDGTTSSCGCKAIVREWHDEPKPETRTCTKCSETKPLSLEFFYNHPLGKWGFDTKCIICVRKEQNRRNRADAGKLRLKCLHAYSSNPPKCQCPGCQENHLEFLTIDHIHGGGGKHRASIPGNNLYRWLARNNFPEGFRVLCWNCNASRGKYGYCPHEKQ